MNPGDLRHRVEIQTRVSTSSGDTWTKLRNQWAKIAPIGSSELTFLSARHAKVSHTIRLRLKPVVNVGERVVHDSKNYDVIGVEKFFEDRQEVLAELVQ